MAIGNILDPVLGPLLDLPPIYAVFIVSFLISFLATVITKYTTNQKKMKELKDELKMHQEELKQNRENPEKMPAINKKMMESNMKYMKESFRSMIFTMIPYIIVFSWLAAHFEYDPINPQEQFAVMLEFQEGKLGNISALPVDSIQVIGQNMKVVGQNPINFTFQGNEGLQSIKFKYLPNDGSSGCEIYKEVLITDSLDYLPNTPLPSNNCGLKNINIVYEKKPIFPYLNLNWFWSYFIFAIVFGMILRKALKVH